VRQSSSDRRARQRRSRNPEVVVSKEPNVDIRKPAASGKTTIFAMLLSIVGAIMVFVPWFRLGSLNGMMSWHGIVDLIVWILLFLFLVATSPLKPVPLWRTFPLVAGGALVLLFTGLFIGHFNPAPLDAGVYLEFGSGVALLFVAALEIRGQLIRWQAERLVRVTAVEDTSNDPDHSDFAERIQRRQ